MAGEVRRRTPRGWHEQKSEAGWFVTQGSALIDRREIFLWDFFQPVWSIWPDSPPHTFLRLVLNLMLTYLCLPSMILEASVWLARSTRSMRHTWPIWMVNNWPTWSVIDSRATQFCWLKTHYQKHRRCKKPFLPPPPYQNFWLKKS